VPIFTSAIFSQIFRAEAYSVVEYSFDAAPDRRGVMVGGKPGFLTAVQQFAAGLPFAADWTWSTQRFTELVRPDAFLLRCDCRAEEIMAITLYCRFPMEPDDNAFCRYMRAARPFTWTGPSPGAIAALLGVPGPRGIGFRVDATGDRQTALYYRVQADTGKLPPEVLPQLVRVCGLPESLAETIGADIHSLYPPGPVGVIGVDCGEDGWAKALKFDPANVPLSKALSFLGARLASVARMEELSSVARSLRAQWVSYLGAKYGAEGFAGWRVYFSVRPDLLPGPLLPRIVVERSANPTFHLPHY